MGYTINSTKYPPRKPRLDITADSLDDVAELTNIAEGSTLTVGEDHYEGDSVDGWVTPGGGGGGGESDFFVVHLTPGENYTLVTTETAEEIINAIDGDKPIIIIFEGVNTTGTAYQMDYEEDPEDNPGVFRIFLRYITLPRYVGAEDATFTVAGAFGDVATADTSTTPVTFGNPTQRWIDFDN